MKKNKLEKYESKVRSEPSPEQIKQAQNRAVDMIMAVYERMPKDNIKPVKESLQELARQAKEGVSRQPTIIDSGENSAQNVTKIISGNDENSPKIVTKFTAEEIKLLNEISAR